MAGDVTTKAGRYFITDKVWFEIHQQDAGTFISVSDSRVNRRYALCLDESAVIVRGVVEPITEEGTATAVNREAVPPVIKQHVQAYDANLFYRALGTRNPLLGFKAWGKYRFTLQHGRRARPRNKCFPMAGYSNGQSTFVMYRVPSTGKGEGLLKLLPGNRAVIDNADPERLAPEEWKLFLDLPPGRQFKLNNQSWTKLGIEQVQPLVAGKIIQRVAEQE